MANTSAGVTLEAIPPLVDEKIKTGVYLKGEGGKGQRRGRDKPILESKEVTDILTVADTKSYMYWDRRLKTAIEQVRPGSRKALE